ncbi:MAG: hypothetical protein IPM25_13285 [Chloracidobacterium sp.]|nr:hypothetical protein [Chloracidobacterium sp.]
MKKRIIATVTLLVLFGSVVETLAQTRIRFARGRTSTTVTGTLASIGERDFVLRAAAGQYLSATVSSSGDCIKFSTIETAQAFRTDEGDNWLKLMNMCRRRVSFTMTVSIR